MGIIKTEGRKSILSLIDTTKTRQTSSCAVKICEFKSKMTSANFEYRLPPNSWAKKNKKWILGILGASLVVCAIIAGCFMILTEAQSAQTQAPNEGKYISIKSE